jgi:hypothetical protein
MSTPSRLRRIGAACSLAALAAACGGGADAPVAPGGRPPTVTAFVYDPAAAETFDLGRQHRITFAAGAVCDPTRSTYGVTEWDAPCAPLTAPIAITATSTEGVDGRPRVDFAPALRFVPEAEVVLYLRDPEAAEDPTAVIQWCATEGSCVTEPAPTPSAETRRDRALGVVYRAIKHFSGYTISAGRRR